MTTAEPSTAPAADEAASDPVFAEEQQHLSQLYARLEQLRDDLTRELETEHEGAAEDLRTMSEEIRPNFNGLDETMETLAAIETLNSVIDAYNQHHDFSADKLRRVLLLLRQPYFAKVRLVMRPGRPARDVYIGTTGMTDERSRPIVVDWRNPIAETYYNQENGRTSYVVNGKVREVELELRRQFDIDADRLNAYFDTTVAIEDSLLLGALTGHHSEKLRDITATIQREQNEVVRHEDVPVLLVNGIAGSGKTSVMLQRIAFLLYRQRETLSPGQVHLFGPNDVFERYIDSVLPSLGEQNPQVSTWKAFVAEQGAGQRAAGENTDPAELDRLEEALGGLELEEDDLRGITVSSPDLGDVTLVKAGQVLGAAEKFMRFGVGPRFCALVTDELHERIDRRVAQLARTDAMQEKMLGLSADEQMDVFGELVTPEDDAEIARLTKRYLVRELAGAHKAANKLAWLRLDRVGMRMLGKQALSASELLYLRLLIARGGDPDARYVMIDEVQDYTVTQLRVLARFFSRAHFLMLGDQNQAIREGTATFEQIAEVFRRERGQVDECQLLTSYRSSPEITALFSGLVERGGVKLASVRREGEKPLVRSLPGRDELLDELRRVVRAAGAEEGLTAVVARDEGAARWFAKQLGDLAHLVGPEEDLQGSGVVVMPLRLAKGLEFDQVVIPDADAEHYPDTPLARRRLYTGVSRAMHKAVLLAQGELSPLLAPFAE